MRRIVLIMVIGIFCTFSSNGQSPESIRYQSVVRDNNGNLITNQNVRFRISILKSTPSGTVVFSESHLAATNDFGLANLVIGAGEWLGGDFESINWGNDLYFLKVEMDPAGGYSYLTMGTSQFLSVPYALHAKTAETGGNTYQAGTGLTLNGNTFNSVWSVNGSHIFNNNSGHIGIGITAPARQLELTQSLRMPATTNDNTGVIYKGSDRFIHNYQGPGIGRNLFIGVNSGNFSTSGTANYHASYNTGLGEYALTGLTTGYHNTAVGNVSLATVTTGYYNSAVGSNALYQNVDGVSNTAVGYQASSQNTSGSNNVALGNYANLYNQTGSNNTLVGYEAGAGSNFHNKSGNVFIGYQAGKYEIGSNKLYIDNSSTSSPLIGGDFSLNEAYINGKLRISDGTQANGRILLSAADGTASWSDPAVINDGDWIISGTNLYLGVAGYVGFGITNPSQQLEITQSIRMPSTINNSTGVIFKGNTPFLHNYKGPVALGFNTFLGIDAGNFTMGGGSNYLGCNNTGIGQGTLTNVTSGYANTAVGAFSLQQNTTGFENTAIGLQAMIANTTGSKNTGAGYFAMHENTTGGQNTSLGFGSNYYNQTGGYNTIIGYEAGRGTAVHSKAGNVFIGYQAGYNETGSNKLYIENSSSSAPLIGGDFSTDQIYFNGVIGAGTTTPHGSAAMDVSSSTKGLLPPRMTTAQIAAISSPAAGLMVYNTTTNTPNYFNGTYWVDFSGNAAYPQVGAFWGGGIVFYVDGSWHGLVSSLSDQSAAIQWGCAGTLIGGTQPGLYWGEPNTELISASCGTSSIAAKTCLNLDLNGYSDWFLPSKDELLLMYQERNIIGGFTGNNYWSSTEYDADKAWKHMFFGNYQISDYKYNNYAVRCIRFF